MKIYVIYGALGHLFIVIWILPPIHSHQLILGTFGIKHWQKALNGLGSTDLMNKTDSDFHLRMIAEVNAIDPEAGL